MAWIGWVHCEKSRHDFVAQTFALIAPVDPFLHRVSYSYETIPNASQHFVTHQNMSLGSNVVDRECRCEKFRHDFMARTFTLIALVWRVMYQVSWSSETVPNAPKRKETHQNMRLGSNGMDRKRSLWKILTRHHGTNFCINCSSLARFCVVAKQFQMHPNGNKRTKTWV